MLLGLLVPALLLRRAFGGPFLTLRRLVVLRVHEQRGASQHRAENSAAGNHTRRVHEICSLEDPLGTLPSNLIIGPTARVDLFGAKHHPYDRLCGATKAGDQQPDKLEPFLVVGVV
jgi:hypothetical protein